MMDPSHMPAADRQDNKEFRIWIEVAAIILGGLGLLVFLALISFDRNDYDYIITPANNPPNNLIGSAGKNLAGVLVLLLGLAAYLIPVVMFFGAIAMVYTFKGNYYRKSLWFLLLMISGACLLQLARPLLGVFSDFGLIGHPGGLCGYLLNDLLLARYMGPAGSAIVMGITYLISFVLLFEIRPVEFFRQTVGWISSRWEERQQARLEAADPMERLELEQRRIQREAQVIQKKLAKKNIIDKTRPVSGEIPTARPAPRVIDTTALQHDDGSTPAAEEEHRPTAKTAATGPAAKIKPKEKTSLPASLIPSYEHYQLPDISLLTNNDGEGKGVASTEELELNQQLLVDTLLQFGIEVTPGDITKGATITRYEVYPAAGVRVERISSLEKNLARALKAERVNILAPIPGKDTVGIEVPNSQKMKIVLRDLLESNQWKNTRARLPMALGKDVYGSVLVADLADMPHLLIAGTTGSGKSVCINCVLLSLLYRFSPDDLRIILIDPKVVELQVYNQLPHLVVPVVTDPKKVLVALRWVINEMERRYRYMARAGVRNIAAYNQHAHDRREKEKLDLQERLEALDKENSAEPGPVEEELIHVDPVEEEPLPDRLPFIVVIIDELADLMQTAPADVELAIARLSAKARAAGIHLIIATQTPRAQVITGVIKTNVPCRIAFQVPSALDSRVILDENGAENLLGKGDLLYLPPGSAKLVRATLAGEQPAQPRGWDDAESAEWLIEHLDDATSFVAKGH